MKILTANAALTVIKSIPLVVECELKSAFDFLSSITTERELAFEPVPPVYYRVMEGTDCYYTVHAFYHRYDPVARHHHDFEGVVSYMPKDKNKACIRGYCHHWDFLFNYSGQPLFVNIEAGSHALSGVSTVMKTVLRYKNFNYICMDDQAFMKRFEEYREMFRPSVKMPDDWQDTKMNVYAAKKRPIIGGRLITSSKGLLWNDPEKFFALARLVKKI